MGIEFYKDKLLVYQEAQDINFLSGLVVKNNFLVDTYSKQVNTVNFQDSVNKGSMTFTKTKQIVKIDDIN